MTARAAPRPIAGWFMLALAFAVIILAMTYGREKAGTAVSGNGQGEWVLEEFVAPPHGWRTLEISGRPMRFATQKDCKEFGRERRARLIEAGKHAPKFRCVRG